MKWNSVSRSLDYDEQKLGLDCHEIYKAEILFLVVHILTVYAS